MALAGKWMRLSPWFSGAFFIGARNSTSMGEQSAQGFFGFQFDRRPDGVCRVRYGVQFEVGNWYAGAANSAPIIGHGCRFRAGVLPERVCNQGYSPAVDI
jgi:hypothetical protein